MILNEIVTFKHKTILLAFFHFKDVDSYFLQQHKVNKHSPVKMVEFALLNFQNSLLFIFVVAEAENYLNQ